MGVLPQVRGTAADPVEVAGSSSDASHPTLVRRTLRPLLGAVLLVVAGYVGRATVIDGHGLSLIWPAIGVAGLWFASGSSATWPTDGAAIFGSTVLVTATTGVPLPVALVFAASGLLQVAVFVALVRRPQLDVWGLGGSGPLARIADLGRITVAAALSGIAGIVAGVLGVAVTVDLPPADTLVVWWGRNTVALIVIVVLGVLLGQPLAAAAGPRQAAQLVLEAVNPGSAIRAVEAGALIGTTAALSLLIFADDALQPLAFLLLATSVWAGLRFGAVAVTVHGVIMGASGVAFTLAGEGPFADTASVTYRAAVAQIFVAMSVLTGLALSFSRAERDAANRDLAAARRAADERAHLLDVVLETMQEGIVVVEEGGRILVRNAAARALVGLTVEPPDELQPAAAYGLFHGNGLPVRDDELPAVRALRGEVVEPEDLHVRGPSVPHGRVLEFAARPLDTDGDTGPRRAMVHLRDVTVDRQHRDTLASFAGVIAHDLFNPLTVVAGWTEALSDELGQGPLPPSVGAPIIERIRAASEHMRLFIADLMSYTIARDQSLRYGPVDLTETVRSLANLWAEEPSQPMVVVGDGLSVWADAGLVRQLLDNLIGNAIKYVAPGVRPMVEITGTSDGDWLEIRVADNGIGIPEGEREAVFDSLHRAHGDRFKGTGLGLAICRRIVDRHGGTIHVGPRLHGSGSVFVFRLPRLAAAGSDGEVGRQALKVTA